MFASSSQENLTQTKKTNFESAEANFKKKITVHQQTISELENQIRSLKEQVSRTAPSPIMNISLVA